MKKRNLVISLILALIVVHITSIIFIYTYASMSVLENSLIYSINTIALMCVVKTVLSLLRDKINKKVSDVIFVVILLINIVAGIVVFKEFIL